MTQKSLLHAVAAQIANGYETAEVPMYSEHLRMPDRKVIIKIIENLQKVFFPAYFAGGTDKVWFYDMKADGFSLDDKRTEVKENDIPDIIARFHNLDAETDRKRTEQSFFVPKEEIAANGYDLSINKYKETEYVPVEYPSTTEILADLHELEMEITKGLAELEEMV